MELSPPKSGNISPCSVRAWIGVLVIALVLRAGWAMLVPVVPVSDSAAYDTFARNLAVHHFYGWTAGSPSAFWPVGTSFAYSVLYRFFGEIYTPIVVFNIAISLVTVLLIMALGTRWANPAAGVLAGLLFAIWPSQIEFTTVLASELIFNFCVLAAIYFWSRQSKPSWIDAVLAGIPLAAASYVRPLALVLPVVFLAWTPGKNGWGITLAKAAVAAAVMFVLILPWSIRNQRAFGSFVAVSTNGGTNLWMGNNPASEGHFMALPSNLPPGMNEAQEDAYLGRIAKDFIRRNPAIFARMCVRRLLNTYDRETIGVVWNSNGLQKSRLGNFIALVKIVSTGYWGIMMLGAVAGAATLFARGPFLTAICHPAIVMVVYFAVVHMVTVSNDRYHFPCIPFIAILAAMGLQFVRKWPAQADRDEIATQPSAKDLSAIV